MNKKPVSWTIDEDVIEAIEKEGDKQNRSSSFIANQILTTHFKGGKK